MGNKASGCGCYKGRGVEPETILVEDKTSTTQATKRVI